MRFNFTVDSIWRICGRSSPHGPGLQVEGTFSEHQMKRLIYMFWEQLGNDWLKEILNAEGYDLVVQAGPETKEVKNLPLSSEGRK